MSALARAARLWGEAFSVDGPTGNVRLPKETGPAAIQNVTIRGSAPMRWWPPGDGQPGLFQYGSINWPKPGDPGYRPSSPAADVNSFFEQAKALVEQDAVKGYGSISLAHAAEAIQTVRLDLDPDGPVAS